MKKVIVTWIDAVSEDSWTDIEEAVKQECHEQETLGFLIHEDDRKIVVAASYDKQNGKVASFYSIPSTWLVSIEEIL
jgi:hypothetical protein